MKDSAKKADTIAEQRSLAGQTLRWFASLKLAVLLLVGIAVVLAAATVLESADGREYAQWHVYKNPWFMALLGLLALNILAATILRFPWRRGRRGFLLTHAGVLALLAGAMLTFTAGIEGQLALEEGQSGDVILLTDHSQLTTVWHRNENRLPSAFIFQPGPTDWPEGKSVDLGSFGEVQLEVLKFYRHARTEEQWVEDRSAAGKPAVQLALTAADGPPMVEQWLVADPFADEVFLGSARLTFQAGAGGLDVGRFRRSAPRRRGFRRRSVDALRGADVPDSGAGKRGKEAGGRQERHPGGNCFLPARCPARRGSPFHLRRPTAEQPAVGVESLPARQGATAAANRLRQTAVVEPRRNSRLGLPGEVLVSPSGGCAGSGRAILADSRRQAALSSRRGRQAALARRGEGGWPDRNGRPTPPVDRQVPSPRPPEGDLPSRPRLGR